MAQSKSKPPQPSATQQLWAKRLWKALGIGIGFMILVFIILSFTKLPSFDDLENPIDVYASDVIAADGKVIGRHFSQNRVPVIYDSLSPHLVNALIATEDARFYSHSGVDFKALIRVGFRTILLRQKSGGGGSTITQQLAKRLFSDRDFSGMNRVFRYFNLVVIKFKEWIVAVKLERRYTKEEIIAMYFNEVDFIHDAYGIQSAAETYFGKNQQDLSIEEAAMLVGMLKNPALYNPMRRPEIAQERRNTVLNQMRKAGHINREELDSLKLIDIDMGRFKRATHSEGLARYFMMEVKREVEKILNDPEHRKPDGSKYNIYRDGLKIYTTIDTRMQKYAEEAMVEHMTEVQKRYNQEWKNRDPWKDGADNAQKELRQEVLKSQVRNSDRYRDLRSYHMDDVLAKISDNFSDIKLSDRDLELMHEERSSKGTFVALQKQNRINSDRVSKLERIMKSNSWEELSAAWLTFQEQMKKDFETKVKMKVFAYNPPTFEKDTLMSPLDSVRYHRMIMQAGILAVEPSTGYIKAWVGGVNYRYFQYDHIRSSRQVGSTFKPFVYAAAIANYGISPCFPVQDIQYTISKDEGNFGLLESWSPKNSEGKFTNTSMTLYTGLRNSVNSVSVFLMKQLGDTEPIRGMLHSMGIDSTEKRQDGGYRLPKSPSICLGAADLSVFEMTGAYATFANNGVFKKPQFITHIEDHTGRVVYRAVAEETVALPSEANYVMVDLLKNASGGAPGIGSLKSEAGGKTGTTNDHVDGWFMGITPGLVVGTWVGGEDRWIRFRSFANGQGSRMARPIFAGLMKRIEADNQVDYDPKLRFFVPPEPRSIVTKCNEYRNPLYDKVNSSGEYDEIDEDFKMEEF